MMETGRESLEVRLRAACVEHPAAEIPWPHRILHEAADEIANLTARLAETERERELREALTTIKEIVSDKFLHKHEKLEVIESRCDISLCNEALAKSHG